MGIEEAIRLNCSTIFLLPGIGFQRRQLLKYGFIAAYIDDRNHEPHYKDCVYLLFKPPDMDLFQIFLDNEYFKHRDHQVVVEDYDYAKGYVVVVYRFPEQFMNEYSLFLKGKYSLFRTVYTSLFPTKIEVLQDDGSKALEFSLPYLIFNKVDKLKEFWEEKIGEPLDKNAECWTAPDLEDKEVLNINVFY
jgi:hypothetical protein